MFRVADADEAWKQETRTRIEATTQRFRDQIKELQVEVRPDFREPQDLTAYSLAIANNQLAWLIGNTVGDPDEAIRCSRTSLALRPNDSGYLDTLGRCYYAKGDYASAIKYQKQALADEPHSPAMLKQLALFHKALEEQNAAAGKTPAQPGDANAGTEGGKRP